MAGSASKDSYKKMLASSLKKISSNAGEGEEGVTVPAPASKKGRKRASPAEDGAEGKDAKKTKKAAKPRGKKAKKQAEEEANTMEAV